MPPAKKKQKHSSNAARVLRSEITEDHMCPTKQNQEKNQSNSLPLVQVLRPEMYVETTGLLSDEIFVNICLKKWDGHLFCYSLSSYDQVANQFTVKYEMQTILHDGVSFLSDDDGEVEIIHNVKLEIIQQGTDQYNAALCQISKHRIKEKLLSVSLCRKTTLMYLFCQRRLISVTSMQKLP